MEALAVVSFAVSVWLLARNKPAGWWAGLVGIVAYGVVFASLQQNDVGVEVVFLRDAQWVLYVDVDLIQNRMKQFVEFPDAAGMPVSDRGHLAGRAGQDGKLYRPGVFPGAGQARR